MPSTKQSPLKSAGQILNEPIQVPQPTGSWYSPTHQNVASSLGSTAIPKKSPHGPLAPDGPVYIVVGAAIKPVGSLSRRPVMRMSGVVAGVLVPITSPASPH